VGTSFGNLGVAAGVDSSERKRFLATRRECNLPPSGPLERLSMRSLIMGSSSGRKPRIFPSYCLPNSVLDLKRD
jgi:hypothetical protein